MIQDVLLISSILDKLSPQIESTSSLKKCVMCWVIFLYISSPNVDFWWNLGIAHGFELKGNPLELTSRAGMGIDQQEVLTQDTIERVGENCINNFLV